MGWKDMAHKSFPRAGLEKSIAAIYSIPRLRDEHPPDFASVERVLEVARGEILGTEVTGGRSVRRTGGTLRIETLSKGSRKVRDSG